MEIDPAPASYSCDSSKRGPSIDPALRSVSDQFFVNVRSEAYRCVRIKETDILAVPWGPRVDVMFDPKGALGIVGGKIRVMARTAGTEVEIDDRGVRPVPGAVPGIPWEEVVDVYAERYGRRTVAALRLDSGATVRLPVPYDGCLLGHDPGFEDKLFTLRHLWETHRRWHTP